VSLTDAIWLISHAVLACCWWIAQFWNQQRVDNFPNVRLMSMTPGNEGLAIGKPCVWSAADKVNASHVCNGALLMNKAPGGFYHMCIVMTGNVGKSNDGVTEANDVPYQGDTFVAAGCAGDLATPVTLSKGVEYHHETNSPEICAPRAKGAARQTDDEGVRNCYGLPPKDGGPRILPELQDGEQDWFKYSPVAAAAGGGALIQQVSTSVQLSGPAAYMIATTFKRTPDQKDGNL
jgi:hypothetical protein